MRTPPREIRFLWRMAGMVALGVALELVGILLYPPRALLHALHKENRS